MLRDSLRALWLCSALGCGESTPVDTTSGSTTSSTEGGTAGDTTTGAEATTINPTTSAPSTTASDDESSTGVVPEGPACSVQVVTHGALVDPLTRGEVAGALPTPVADVLEDHCGCHTLMSEAQNLDWPGYDVPDGSLLLTHADLARPFGGGTLGGAIEAEVRGATMPVGSCPLPAEPEAVLLGWFDQGMPDGAAYVP